MRLHSCILIPVLLLLGCQKENQIAEHLQTPESKLVISGGSMDEIRKGILSYIDLTERKEDETFIAHIYSSDTNQHLVEFPNGIAPYDLANLIGWFGFSDGAEGNFKAKGLITSYSSAVRYTLQPEYENKWKDSLVGTGSDGTSVRVCLVHGGLCKLSKPLDPIHLADDKEWKLELSLSIPVIVDDHFGNPAFRITHPIDTKGLAWAP